MRSGSAVRALSDERKSRKKAAKEPPSLLKLREVCVLLSMCVCVDWRVSSCGCL